MCVDLSFCIDVSIVLVIFLLVVPILEFEFSGLNILLYTIKCFDIGEKTRLNRKMNNKKQHSFKKIKKQKKTKKNNKKKSDSFILYL
jgi:hypothetical protein